MIGGGLDKEIMLIGGGLDTAGGLGEGLTLVVRDSVGCVRIVVGGDEEVVDRLSKELLLVLRLKSVVETVDEMVGTNEDVMVEGVGNEVTEGGTEGVTEGAIDDVTEGVIDGGVILDGVELENVEEELRMVEE